MPISKFLVIAGPTGVGKSEIAVGVAERLRGEIIGADAFQIYCEFNILTARPVDELLSRVPHHLIGAIPISEPFHVAEYLSRAQRCMREIRSRGRLPIVVGGTGLYIRALTHGLAEFPGMDSALRALLSGLSLADLQARLLTLDPQAHAHLDLHNPRRVIRAIEICQLTGHPYSAFQAQWKCPPKNVRGVFLNRERADLYARIDRRTEAMFAAGVEAEVQRCENVHVTASMAIGFRHISELLRGESSRADCIAAIRQATRRYAKRQITWFRRDDYLEKVAIAGREGVGESVRKIVRQLSGLFP